MGRVKDYIIQAGSDISRNVQFLPLVTRDNRGFGFSVFLTARAVARIWSAKLSGRLALVHVNVGDRASAARKGMLVLLGRLSGAKVILHLHAVELHEHYRRGGFLLRSLIALPFLVATHNIVLGDLWRRWLVEEVKVRPERIDILLNGVPIDEPPLTRHVAKFEAPIQLLFLGNLIKRKGVGDLIEALALLSPDLPPWRLTLAGGGNVEAYRELAARLGLVERLDFVEWVDQDVARRLLREADLLVLPSHREGLPLVILEAMGSGTPVLCTPVGAIPEALTDRRTAIFCPPGSSADLAARLTELITDPQLLHSLSDEGLEAWRTQFNVETFIAALFAIYRDRCGVEIEGVAPDHQGMPT